MKDLDLLIVAGSQQLIDFIEGPWGHPYNIFKFSFLAKLRNAKMVFLSVGAGPINKRLSKYFIKYSLSNASYRSYRDANSLKLINSIGVGEKDIVSPDLVYNLNVEDLNTSVKLSTAYPVIAINLVPFSDPVYWPGSSLEAYDKYIAIMAEFSSWLLKEGYKILYFPTQLNLDTPVIQDIKSYLKNNFGVQLDGNIFEINVRSLTDLISALSGVKLVVATRFHGIIIPLILNKPVLGIAYHQKTFDLMESMGLPECVIGINDLDIEDIKKKFLLLLNNADNIHNIIKDKLSYFKNDLDTQYDTIMKLLN